MSNQEEKLVTEKNTDGLFVDPKSIKYIDPDKLLDEMYVDSESLKHTNIDELLEYVKKIHPGSNYEVTEIDGSPTVKTNFHTYSIV